LTLGVQNSFLSQEQRKLAKKAVNFPLSALDTIEKVN